MRTDLIGVSISLKYSDFSPDKKWYAILKWLDSRWAVPGSVEGTIRTRYAEATIAKAVDAVLEIADQFSLPIDGISLFGWKDGQDPDHALPDGWQSLVLEECKRRGWYSHFKNGPFDAR